MIDHPPGYEGDDALTQLFAKAAIVQDAASARAFLAGIIAAPERPDPGEWLALLAPEADAMLSAQIAALCREIADSAQPGFTLRPPAERIEALRRTFAERKLAGFIVPRSDEYQGEYVPPRAGRLRWLTGFSGSAGTAVILEKAAAVFSDGRYTLQLRQEIDTALFETPAPEKTPPEWTAGYIAPGERIGYDPALMSQAEIQRWHDALLPIDGVLVPMESNPVDAVWKEQPAAPISPVVPHGVEFAGIAAAEKRRNIAGKLKAAEIDAAVLTLPESIAWLLNIRGGDIAHMPVALSFAIIRNDASVEWFIDERKLTVAIASHLDPGVAIHPIGEFEAALKMFSAKDVIRADPATASALVFDALVESGAQIDSGNDPCLLAKACKNDIEIAGIRAAHLRDGAALTRFLAWFDEHAGDGKLTELDAATRLRAFRAEDPMFRDLSFPTISAAGPHGAIVHYSVTPETNRTIAPDDIYLVDSGAQYPDGTTDVTRTITVGTPDAEVVDRFTRVLRGHIALASARFPEGTAGGHLDVLARAPLWEAGFDFNHGTGHGVGAYLGVHEGPQRIARWAAGPPLEPGMVISNEPGYYREGRFGIRIENLVLVRDAALGEDAEQPMREFETLTLAPIDLRLVDPGLMTPTEREWLDRYHARVRDTLSPLLDAPACGWLEAATRKIAA